MNNNDKDILADLFSQDIAIGPSYGPEQIVGERITNQQAMTALSEMVNNRLGFDRFMATGMFGDKTRNIEQECGYKPTRQLTAHDYQEIFDREPVAARVVNVLPMECWQQPPQLFEDEDVEISTPFELAWSELGRNLLGPGYFQDDSVNPLWEYLERADIISGIGSYGCILLGIDDGVPLSEPADMDANYGRKLLYIRVLSETEARISRLDDQEFLEDGTANPHFGKPEMYAVLFGVPTLTGKQAPVTVTGDGHVGQIKDVHWTRIVHIVDNPTGNEVGGIPRMQQVYNRLYDLHKLYGGSAEMYWQGAFPGIKFETHPQLGGDVKIDWDRMRQMVLNWRTGLQRQLAMPGGTIDMLAPTVVDPTPQILAEIDAICILIGCPKRVFMGSERGELASSQDIRAWYARCGRRQRMYMTPRLVCPFVDRLIMLGVLPIPQQGYRLDWPDLASLTDLEKAQVASQLTMAMSSYMMGGLFQMIDPKDYLVHICGFNESVVNQWIENTQANMEQMQEAHLEQSTAPPEEEGGPPQEEGAVGNVSYDADLHEVVWDDTPRFETNGHTNNSWSEEARKKALETRRRNKKSMTTDGKAAKKLAGEPTPNIRQPGKTKYSPTDVLRGAASGKYTDAALAAAQRAATAKSTTEKLGDTPTASMLNAAAGHHKFAAEHHKIASALTKDAALVAHHTMQVGYHTKQEEALGAKFVETTRKEQAQAKPMHPSGMVQQPAAPPTTAEQHASMDRRHDIGKAKKAALAAVKTANIWAGAKDSNFQKAGRLSEAMTQLKGAIDVLRKHGEHQEADRLDKKLLVYGKSFAKVENKQHKFSSTQVDVNDKHIVGLIRELQELIDMNDDIIESETRPHITVRYGLHTTSYAEVQEWLEGGKIIAEIRNLAVFTEHPDHDVLHFKIQSPMLMRLNERLMGLENTETHKYNPHLTVAYIKKGSGYKYTDSGINPLFGTRLWFNEVIFSNTQGKRKKLTLT